MSEETAAPFDPTNPAFLAAVASAVASARAADKAAEAKAAQTPALLCKTCGGNGRRGERACLDCKGSGGEADTQRFKDAQAAADTARAAAAA